MQPKAIFPFLLFPSPFFPPFLLLNQYFIASILIIAFPFIYYLRSFLQTEMLFKPPRQKTFPLYRVSFSLKLWLDRHFSFSRGDYRFSSVQLVYIKFDIFSYGFSFKGSWLRLLLAPESYYLSQRSNSEFCVFVSILYIRQMKLFIQVKGLQLFQLNKCISSQEFRQQSQKYSFSFTSNPHLTKKISSGMRK